jgi:phospholipid-binding lipoprotein MlaA
MSRTVLPIGLALASLVLHGCASLPEGRRDPRDPFERFNRSVYQFNDALDRGIARPLARGYTKITPDPVETGVSNFFENLTYPTTIVNDVLQLKPTEFVQATARLVVNTTLGIGGLFDPATQLGIPSGDEDLGQTLGRWGVPPGPYIMVPIFGPYSARDVVADLADQYTNPRVYIDDPWLRYGLWGLEQIEQRASLLGTDEVLQRAFDPYAFIRNAYFERRKFQVSDGTAPPEELEIFEDETPAD